MARCHCHCIEDSTGCWGISVAIPEIPQNPFHHQSCRIAGESYVFHILHSVAFIVNCFKNEQSPMQLCPTVKIHGSIKAKYIITHVSVNSMLSPRICYSIPGYYGFSSCKLYHLDPSTRDITIVNADDPCELTLSDQLDVREPKPICL